MKINMTVKGVNYEDKERKGIIDEMNFSIECEAAETIEALKVIKETIILKLENKKEER